MATRSTIGYVTEDGKVRGTYCHFDGYPAGVGRELFENYHTPEAVEALVQYEISSLDVGDGVPEYIENEIDGPYTWSNEASFLNDFDLFGSEYAYLLTEDGWVVNAQWDSAFEGYHWRELEEIVEEFIGAPMI
jgi:hypothetical protein